MASTHLRPFLRNFARHLSTFSPPQRVIFSGIQPTGTPHLGNYFGALRQWVQLQSSTAPDNTKLIFCIVDLHAITIPQNPAILRQRRKEMMAALLALGLDPKRCTIFEQSRVPAHSELMWILSCGASTGYLSRMTQWKAYGPGEYARGVWVNMMQSKSGIDENSQQSPIDEKSSTAKLKLGLFSYPVLQAADILAHSATEVPVGEDQAQHLELTRELVQSFHHTYGEVWPLPKTVLSPARRVMSLYNPVQKMSKSDQYERSRILLTDTPEEIEAKFKKAVTDSIEGISYDPKERPGVSNLVQILAHTNRREDFEAVAKEMERLNMTGLKAKVTDAVVQELEGFRREYDRIIKEGDGYLEEIAKEGAKKATESAEETMVRVRKAIGLP